MKSLNDNQREMVKSFVEDGDYGLLRDFFMGNDSLKTGFYLSADGMVISPVSIDNAIVKEFAAYIDENNLFHSLMLMPYEIRKEMTQLLIDCGVDIFKENSHGLIPSECQKSGSKRKGGFIAMDPFVNKEEMEEAWKDLCEDFYYNIEEAEGVSSKVNEANTDTLIKPIFQLGR